jgi:glutamine synthetase adenylyltransferase
MFRSKAGRRTIKTLIDKSPSPPLAVNNLARLVESGGQKALKNIPDQDLPVLLRLLGSSSFLSDILLRQGKHWPELFLRQIKVARKSVTAHSNELRVATEDVATFPEFCAVLRRHKQREYLRIGARDLFGSSRLSPKHRWNPLTAFVGPKWREITGRYICRARKNQTGSWCLAWESSAAANLTSAPTSM